MTRTFSRLQIAALAIGAAGLWFVLWWGGDPASPESDLALRTWDAVLEAKLGDLARAAGAADAEPPSPPDLDPLLAEARRAAPATPAPVEAPPGDGPEARPDPDTLVRLGALAAIEGRPDDAIDLVRRAGATALAELLRRAAAGGPPVDEEALRSGVSVSGLGPWLRARLAHSVAERAGDEGAQAWALARVEAARARLAGLGVLVGAVIGASALAGLLLLALAPWRLRRWLGPTRSDAAPPAGFAGGVRTAIATTLLWFLAHVAIGVALSFGLVTVAGADALGAPAPLALLLAGSSFLTGVAGLTLIDWLTRPHALFASLGFAAPLGGRGVRWSLGAVVVAVPLVAGGSLLNEWLIGPEPLPPAIALLASEPGPLAFGLLMLATAVLAPVFEEAVFRGYLYPALRSRYGVAAAALVSGAAFALVHVQPANLLPLTALGVLFALVREATGSLRAAILAHALWNLGSVALAGFVFG